MADLSKINEWLQVVGIFGVLASLIFVGLQMKQAHEIALSNTYQSRSDATVDAMMAVTGSFNSSFGALSGRQHNYVRKQLPAV